MESAQPIIARKLCLACCRDLPLDDFYVKSRAEPDKRRSRCKDCCRVGKLKGRRKERGRRIDHAASAIARGPDDRRVRALALVAMRQFGGPVGFARALKEHFDAVREKDAANYRLTNVLMAISTIGRVAFPSGAPNKPARDTSLLSDEDLDLAIKDCVQRMACVE